MLRTLLLVGAGAAVAVGVTTFRDSGQSASSAWQDARPSAAISGASQGEKRPQTAVLTGRVVDDKGEPVPGVVVKLWSGMGTRFAGQSTVTDGAGVYRFDPLESGGGLQGRFMPGVQVVHPDLVSADGENWWDVEVPFGKIVTKDFTLTRGGHIAGSLTFGSGQWTLREFPLKFASTEEPNAKRVAYVTTNGGPGDFLSPALFPGDYDVTWNSPYPQSDKIVRVKVEAGKTTTFKANLVFEMKAECTETPTTK